MEEEDAISLLLKSSREEYSAQSREAARPIVNELCCLPLALDQAGAAIASGLCRIDDYLHRYSQHRAMLLADPTFRGASNYGHPVYGTWDLSFTAIQKMGTRAADAAILLLQTFAFLHHENISEDIIKWAAEAVEWPTLDDGNTMVRDVLLLPQLVQVDQNGSWDPIVFREGIRTLLSYSLMKKAAISGIYSLHPLMHCWSRDHMSHEEQKGKSALAATILSSSITFHFTAKDLAFPQALIPHLKALNQYSAEVGVHLPYQDKQYTCFSLPYDEAG
jgi:hypothetical protein